MPDIFLGKAAQTGPREYPVDTLDDIARIPAEAIPRFIAELPGMLEAIRDSQARMAADGRVIASTATIWVDDGKAGGAIVAHNQETGETAVYHEHRQEDASKN